jgi:hypothetical protein
MYQQSMGVSNHTGRGNECVNNGTPRSVYLAAAARHLRDAQPAASKWATPLPLLQVVIDTSEVSTSYQSTQLLFRLRLIAAIWASFHLLGIAQQAWTTCRCG